MLVSLPRRSCPFISRINCFYYHKTRSAPSLSFARFVRWICQITIGSLPLHENERKNCGILVLREMPKTNHFGHAIGRKENSIQLKVMTQSSAARILRRAEVRG